MDELKGRSNAELLGIATSKNYGKSTRAAAKAILEERGVHLDARDFANPHAGDVPAPPPGTDDGRGFVVRIGIFVIAVALAIVVKMLIRSI